MQLEPPWDVGLVLGHLPALLPALPVWDRCVAWLVTGMLAPSKAVAGRTFSQPAKNKDIILEGSIQDFIQYSLYMHNEVNHMAQGLAI